MSAQPSGNQPNPSIPQMPSQAPPVPPSPPGPPQTPPEPPGKSALLASTDFIKYTVTLGTGALVVSAGLITNKVSLSGVGVACLIASWASLAVSILSGVLAYSRIPVMLSEQNYDLEDRYFIVPGKIHQLSFMAGIFFLGAVLITALIIPGTPTATATATLTPTNSPTPSSTLTLTATSTAVMTLTISPAPSMTPAADPTSTLIEIPTPSVTISP